MKLIALLSLLVSLLVSPGHLLEKTNITKARLTSASAALNAVLQSGDGGNVPQELLDRTNCIVVIPTVIKGGFIVGARYGEGVASCRTKDGWSSPAFIAFGAVSVGWQAGAATTDLILFFTQPNAATALTEATLNMSADANIALGAMGRDLALGTDYAFNSEIIAYSRSAGLFAGLSLESLILEPQKDANETMYGAGTQTADLLRTTASSKPLIGSGFPANGD